MAALIGFLGVIVGGLLGGIVAYRVERRHRRDQAIVAARLITLELDAAARRLTAAADSQMWPAKIRDAQWNDHGSELIGFLERGRTFQLPSTAKSQKRLQGGTGSDGGDDQDGQHEHDHTSASAQRRVGLADKLVGVYSVIGLYNSPPTEADRKEMRKVDRLSHSAAQIEVTTRELENWLARSIPSQLVHSMTVLAAIVLAAAVIIAAFVALIAQRPYVTDATVAETVAAALSGRQEVECLDRPGEAWGCTVYPVAGSTCGASASAAPTTPRRQLADAHPCQAKRNPFLLDVARHGERLIAARPLRSAKAAEIQGFDEILDIPVEERSLLGRAWDKLRGVG